ncbi:MAG: methylenetetrahydrofolate reductase [NAD(P)H] [Clostridiales bacterium]|nr:methylenetetrahydrofolate reductase [NAD(P)H] [Clostridiales bacterium]
MKIVDKFKKVKPLISFEIFPPKADSPVTTIYDTIDDLYNLDPDFMSVTYGAGGSTKDKTVEIASYIQNRYNLTSLAHITCISSTKDEIDMILNSLKDNNVRNIMALRGDYPKDPNVVLPTNRYKNSAELIQHIKDTSDFCIGAACYPEKHPDAKDLDSDIDFLKRKMDAGADFFTTQMFFDNEAFYDFYDLTAKKGINVPITAGIMPILNKRQVNTVKNLTGNAVPKKLMRVLERYENDPEALREAGMAFAISQIIELLSWGVDGIHIYTMNKPDNARKILSSITAIRSVLTSENKIPTQDQSN